MKVRLCKVCGSQLYQKSSRCPCCKTPEKKITGLRYSILTLTVFTVFFLFAAAFSKYDFSDFLSFQEPIHTHAMKKVSAQFPQKIAGKNSAAVFVKGKIVNLRQHPTLKSPILRKLKNGQPLIQVGHSGNWVKVLVDDKEGKRGWIHASLIGKLNPGPSSKALTQHQAFSIFRKYFDQFNTETKKLKGVAFFENVEYLDNGVIQVTATSIFLSAPETYKQKYLGEITKKWLALREPGLSGVVRIVDINGLLRMEKKRLKKQLLRIKK